MSEPINENEILSQKVKEYEELKTEYEEYKLNANEIENLLETELNESKKKIVKFESELKNLKIKEDSLKNELSQIRQGLEKDKKKALLLEIKNMQYEKDNEKLENDLKLLQSSQSSHDLQVEKNELEEKLLQANTEIMNLKHKFDDELESLVIQVKNKEINEISDKYEKKIEGLNKQIENFNNSLKYIAELEKTKEFLENEVSELKQQIANNSHLAISEDIEILEDDLEIEYQKKIKKYEETTEKKLNDKFASDYEEKIKILKENYDKEISKMQEKVKNIEEEFENQSRMKISGEYEKKLLEIKNKYEIEINLLKESIKEIEGNNEKNDEIIIKNLKKSFKNDKKLMEEKIDKLTDEKNLLLQEKNAWEDILKKNSKVFEKIPSFFTSSYFMKSGSLYEEINKNSENNENSKDMLNYLYILNKQKQNQGYRIENNAFFFNKSKKEKIYKFKDIFVNDDGLIDKLTKLAELKHINRKCLILLYGAKKTKKKHFFIEVLEQLIINFLDAIRNKNFPNGENNNEINTFNFELKVSYEQYPPESNLKELNLSLNLQFYVSQMISHHQKLSNSIENSFNKFKAAFMKRNYINKNENSKKIRYFKMSVITCAESVFNEESFFIMTSNKKPTPSKTNNSKFDVLEEILILQNNSKIPDFEQFKECQKNIFYFIDGSKNFNEFSILKNMNFYNEEDNNVVISNKNNINVNNIPFSFEIKKDVEILYNKEEDLLEKTKLQEDVKTLKSERDALKSEISIIKSTNEKLQEEIQKLVTNYTEAPKSHENENQPKSPIPIKENFVNQKNQIIFQRNPEKNVNSTQNTQKKSKNIKSTEEKIYYTPKESNKKKIILPVNSDSNTDIKNKIGDKIIAKIKEINKEIDSDEELMMEEDPRPFPGKFALKKINSLNN